MNFGTIQKVSMNEIWKHEERDFTPWLKENISKLNEALGLELEVLQKEAYAGSFKLDLKAKEFGTNRIAVIENQIYKTDHTHLGQLITYASFFKAEIIIWIAQEITEEHRSAIDWLNNNTNECIHFYAVEADIIKIDDSRPALNFVLKAFPNEVSKAFANSQSNPDSEIGGLYRRFYQGVIDELRDKHHFTNARIAQPQNWYSFTTGTKGCVYACVFTRESRVRTEVYIDAGSKEINEGVLNLLAGKRQELESKFGSQLDFEQMPKSRACRVALYFPGTIQQQENWSILQNWMIQNILKFKAVFGEELKLAMNAKLSETMAMESE